MASLIPLIELAMRVDNNATGVTAIAKVIAEKLSLGFDIPFVLLAFVVLGVISACIKYALSVWQVHLGNRIERECQLQLYTAIVSTGWPTVSDSKGGELLKGVLGDPQQIRSGFLGFLASLTSLLESSVYVILAVVLSVKLTILVAFFAAITLVPYFVFLKRGEEAGVRFNIAWRELFAELTEILSTLKLIFSQGLRTYAISEADMLFKRAIHERLEKEREKLRSRLVFEGAGILFVAFVLYAQLAILQGSAAVGLVFLGVFSRLAPRLATVQTNYFVAVSQAPFLRDWSGRLGRYEKEVVGGGGGLMPVFEWEIKMEDVSYTYPGQNRPALAKTSMIIPRKGTVAITAPSGHGKSTLLGVLCGMLTPQTGRILVDDTPLESIDTQTWQSTIGLVMQENPMFHTSVKENIAWGNGGDIDEERIYAVCRMAGVLDFVEHLPNGLDTVIGDQGSKISGGQRQRLALARALYRTPALLLLDEPTSALDADNERKLIDSLDEIRGEVAMVIVSHRGEILSLADRVYELA